MELDELWSFVLKKSRKRWVWIALCRQTRQVVAFVVGNRSEATCRKLWKKIPAAYQAAHCYSDFRKAYQNVIPEDQHTACGKESGQTAHIERWNNTLRQRLARFVRKTLSFSKKDRMHRICLPLFIHRYNLSLLPTLLPHYPFTMDSSSVTVITGELITFLLSSSARLRKVSRSFPCPFTFRIIAARERWRMGHPPL
ncbi:MAG: IS1 family transposase [Acidobacteriota bacterium]|nr:IS1 family transposase [Acidobacteriota bacterium]